MNLVPAIKSIQAEIREITSEYNAKLRPYKDSLAQLRKINTACEHCFGEGKVLRTRSCAEDDAPDPNDPSDYVSCRYCAGTGKVGEPYERDD